MVKQKCREERREKGEGEFVLSINIKLSISQLQAHENETSWWLPSNSNLTNPPQNTQRQGKKGFFLLLFHEIWSTAELEEFTKLLNTYAYWYQFLFLFLPYQMNNIYEQYHTCVCLCARAHTRLRASANMSSFCKWKCQRKQVIVWFL